MPVLPVRFFATDPEPFPRILPHRLQQAVTRRTTALLGQHQALVGEGSEDVEHRPIFDVLADAGTVADHEALAGAVKAAGARLVLADIAADDGTPRHDPRKLAAAYDAVMGPDEGR